MKKKKRVKTVLKKMIVTMSLLSSRKDEWSWFRPLITMSDTNHNESVILFINVTNLYKYPVLLPSQAIINIS